MSVPGRHWRQKLSRRRGLRFGLAVSATLFVVGTLLAGCSNQVGSTPQCAQPYTMPVDGGTDALPDAWQTGNAFCASVCQRNYAMCRRAGPDTVQCGQACM